MTLTMTFILLLLAIGQLVKVFGRTKMQEIEKITNSLRAQGEPDYMEEITAQETTESSLTPGSEGDEDELFNQAVEIIKAEGKASTSFLQRKLQIGYNRAARIIDMMEEKNIVSKANHVGKREVL